MYHFIVNPKSSSDKGIRKWKLIEAELKKRKTTYQVYFTKHEGHAVCLSGMICKKYETPFLIAVGGDGTANEVIGGIIDITKVTFGYIPTGSSNDLARAMGIPKDPLKTLALILAPKNFLPMNVGIVSSGMDSKRFAVSTGIGYDAAICHEALHSKLKKVLNKVKLGKLTYLGIALKQLILLKPAPLELTLDSGKVLVFKKVFFATLMNHKYEGGGFMFCPGADAADDFLDICVIEQMPKWKVLRLLPTAFDGNHIGHKGVHIYRFKKAHIKTPQPLPVHADGESFSHQSEIEICLLKERLKCVSS